MDLGGHYAVLYFAFELPLKRFLKYPFCFVTLVLIAEGVSLMIWCWLIQHCFVPGHSRLPNIIFCSLLLVHTQSRRKMSGKRG